MATGHDKKCPNCKGSGERLLRFADRIKLMNPASEDWAVVPVWETKIVECALCTGTGLVELDESWEHG